MKRPAIGGLLLLLLLGCASAPPPAGPAPGSPEFQIESTVLAVYNVLSGPAGRRDWDRMKALFAPGAILRSTETKDGVVTATAATPEEFQAKNQPYFAEHGFFEHPIVTRTQRFGDIAQVFSTYETRHASNDAKPYARGVLSVQLIRSGDRWLITGVLRQEEDATHPLPAGLTSSR